MKKITLILSLFCVAHAVYIYTDPLKDVVSARAVVPTVLTLELRNGPARRLASQVRRLCHVYETTVWGRRVPNGVATQICRMNMSRSADLWSISKAHIDRDNIQWLLKAAHEFEMMYNTSTWPAANTEPSYTTWMTDNSNTRKRRSISEKTVWDALSSHIGVDRHQFDAVFRIHHWGAVGVYEDPKTREKRFFIFDAISMSLSSMALSEVRTFRTEFSDSLDATRKIAEGAYDGIVGLEHGLTVVASNIDDVNNRVNLQTEALHEMDNEVNDLREDLYETSGAMTIWVRSGFETMVLRDIINAMKNEAGRTLDERRLISDEIDNIYEGDIPHNRISWADIDRQMRESLNEMGLEGNYLPPREMSWKVIGHVQLNEFDTMVILLSHIIVGEHHRSFKLVHPPFIRDGSLVTTQTCNIVETEMGLCDRDLYLLSCAKGFSKFPVCSGKNSCPMSQCCSSLLDNKRKGCSVTVTPVNETCLSYLTPNNHLVVSGFCNCDEFGQNRTLNRTIHVDGEQIFRPTPHGIRCNGVTVAGRNISLTSTMSQSFTDYFDDWVPALGRITFRHTVNLTSYLPESKMIAMGAWKDEVNAGLNETGEGIKEIKSIKNEVKKDTLASLFNLPGISIPFLGTTSIWMLVWNGALTVAILFLCLKGNGLGYLPVKM